MLNDRELKTEVVLEYICLLGEGPVWDPNRNTICWIDILRGHIHLYSLESKNHSTIALNEMIGSMAVCSDGNFIAALKNGFVFIDRESKHVQRISNPEEHLPANRFNDGKCDPAGRFWAGTLALSEEPNAGSLYMMERDLTITRKIGGVSISNGLAWSPDHQTMYYIDTPTSEIVSYKFEKSTGEISERKVVIKIPLQEGYPDGMTIDSEGMLWIAHWDGWQVSRWDPKTGKKIFHVPMPVARVTSCTFGGKDLSDLYITTARKELTPEQITKQPLAGSLFVLKNCGVKGMPSFEFQR